MSRRREQSQPQKVELPPEPATVGVVEGDDGYEPVPVDDAGDPEPSDVEVQAMLEQMDREERKEPEPPPVAPPMAVVPAEPGQHPLDLAPFNSKIVVTEEGAVLSTPDGVTVLPKSDPASRLPRGARINKTKVGDNAGFVAIQLDAAYPVEPKTYATATEAIADFLEEFHHRAPLRAVPKGNR